MGVCARAYGGWGPGQGNRKRVLQGRGGGFCTGGSLKNREQWALNPHPFPLRAYRARGKEGECGWPGGLVVPAGAKVGRLQVAGS